MVLYTVPIIEGKGLPSLDVHIAHTPGKALLDCASTLNLAHEDFLLRAGVDISEPLPARVLIRGITGSTRESQGMVELPVQVGDATSHDRFVITDANFPGDALLGYHLMKDLKLLVDFGRGAVYTDRLSQTRLIDGLVGMTGERAITPVHPRQEAIGLGDISRINQTSPVTGYGKNRGALDADELLEAGPPNLTVNVITSESTVPHGIQGNGPGWVELTGGGNLRSRYESIVSQETPGGTLVETNEGQNEGQGQGQGHEPTPTLGGGLSLTEVPLPQGSVLTDSE